MDHTPLKKKGTCLLFHWLLNLNHFNQSDAVTVSTTKRVKVLIDFHKKRWSPKGPKAIHELFN